MRNVRRYRTVEDVQNFWEQELRFLNEPELLKPRQKGYVAGEDTPNPAYIDVTPMQRFKMEAQCMTRLEKLLPIHEMEQEAQLLNIKLGRLMDLIEARAPFILKGTGGGGMMQ